MRDISAGVVSANFSIRSIAHDKRLRCLDEIGVLPLCYKMRTQNGRRAAAAIQQVMRLHLLLKSVCPAEIFVRFGFEQPVITGDCLVQLRHRLCGVIFLNIVSHKCCKKETISAALIGNNP